jgi:cell division protein FtsQ
MEFKTNRSDAVRDRGAIPPPDKARRRRKRRIQKLAKSPIGGRRLMSPVRIYGMLAVVVLMLNFVVAVFVYAYTSDRFSLRHITFYGCKEMDEEQLEKTIRHNFPSSILRIDLSQLQGRLAKETWIKSVEIRRILPSDLVVNIWERSPSVILEMQGTLMIADKDGILLDRYDPKYGRLDVPVFRGLLGENPEGYRLHQQENSTRVHRGLSMLAELESGSQSYTRMISEIDLSDPDNLIIMLLDDDAEIHLGKREYLKRFQTLMNYLNSYQRLKDQNDISLIDMRFRGQIRYKLREVHSDWSER